MASPEQEQFLKEALESIARSHEAGLAERMRQKYGVMGKLFTSIAQIFSGGPGHAVTPRDIEEAADLMERSGYDIGEGLEKVPPRRGPPPIPPPGKPPIYGGVEPPPRGIIQPVPRVKQVGRVKQPGQRRALEDWGPELDLDTRILLAPHIEGGGEDDVFSNMIQTPQSSNVYAFGYDKQNKILYVQYKAGGAPVFHELKVNSCNDKIYSMGHRSHHPGPVYAYGSRARPIPPQLYEDMRDAHSKGQFVWDRLRVCGSIWQHQYPYVLVTPTMVGGSLYVPRKASRQGFRVRTVPTVGRGRRPFDRSTLPGYNS